MNQLVRRAAIVAAIGVAVAAASPARADRQTAAQQRCIVKVARAGAKLELMQAAETRGCLRLAATGSLPSNDGQTCQRTDYRSRVAAARAKVASAAAALCGDAPDFGFPGADAVSTAAVEEEIAMSVGMFGSSLALGGLLADENPEGASCQAQVLDSAERALALKLKVFGKCLRLGLKVGSIVEASRIGDCIEAQAVQASSGLDSLRDSVVDDCSGIEAATAFGGRCAASLDEQDLADCLSAVVECHTCQMLTAMHGVAFDCETLDDGLSNGSCGGGITPTTTTITLPPPFDTVCGNDADEAVDAGHDLFAEATTCTYGCLANSNLSQCVATCLSNATGLSPDCALCYGQSSKCGITKCTAQCAADPTSANCATCLNANCIPAFEQCSSVPLQTTTTLDTTTTTSENATTTTVVDVTTTTLPPITGACANSADQAVLGGTDEDAATRTCTFSCFSTGSENLSQCIEDCVAATTGLSADCASCFSDSAVCGIQYCAGVCAANPNSSSCLSCVETHCAAAQTECMGTPSVTTTTLDTTTTTVDTTTTTLPLITGACTNAADRAVDALYDMQAKTTACTLTCLASPTRVSCITSCVVAQTGTSSPCATCYAATAECGLQYCAQECALDQTSPPCLACLDANCTDEFDACTGLGDPPAPATCTNGVKDGTETDKDCGGLCDNCIIGKHCASAADCTSGECVATTCSAPTTTIAYGSCINGYLDPSLDPDALDLGAYGTGADDGYRLTLASASDVYVQLTNQLGSTATLQAAVVGTAGDAASTAGNLLTGAVVAGQNGTAGPATLAAGTYYLYVDSALADTYGPYDICVLPAPTIALGSCVSTSVGNGDGDNVQVAGTGGDKGFRFTPPSTTNVIVKLRNLSGTATMAAGIYNGATLVTSSSTGTAPLFTERHTGLVSVTGGTSYTVQVDTAAAGTAGSFEVCVVQAGCGDGIVSGSEVCDDGNNTGGDGCSASCTLESGKIVVDSCRTDNIPLTGSDCDDWTLPILESEGVYLEVTNPVGATLLAKGSIRLGSTQLVATGNIPIGQSGSTSVANLTAGNSYTARVCDVTGAGYGNYTVCVRSARKVELGSCYAGNVTDGDGNAINLAGPISGGDEDVLFQPPVSTSVKLTMKNKSGGGLLASGVYNGQPGSLLQGSSVGASPSPLYTGQTAQSGLFAVNVGQIYRVYTDIASLGTTGNNYEICLAEVAGDACLNDADELVRSSVNLNAEAESSGVSCTGNSTCISNAMQDVGLSAPCADCFGGTGSCAASHCAGQCLGGSGSSGCRSCVASNCAQEFEVCSGWPYED